MRTVGPKRARAWVFGSLLLAAALAGTFGAATQYVARQLGYHPALGAPLAGRLYAPWRWFAWQGTWYANAPDAFNRAWLGVLGGVGLSSICYVIGMGLATRSSILHEGVHGTAHWADEREVRRSGLLPADGRSGAGVYVGGWTDPQGRLRYLRHNGPEHIAAIAPTRSGKGVGLVVPTLLSWPHSVVVNDMKSELWAMTAGWRRGHAGNVVMKFDPASEAGSVAFNALEEVRLGTPHEVGDVQNLVTILVDPDGKGLIDHWSKSAHALLTGVILHLGYTARAQCGVASLPDVTRALSDPAQPINALYKEMLHNRHLNGEAHPVVAAAARDMFNTEEEERASILSTARSFLSLYRDPLVAGNTARSDFRIGDLMDHERPVSLYLVVRPADKDRLKSLMRLIINQIVRVLVRDELRFEDGRQLPAHRHRLLLLLDEFPSYGRLEVFQEALAYIAGYGIKAYLIMQDVSQLWGAYGRDESIISNCHIRVTYAPNKIETAEWLSRMTGTMTVIKEDISTSGQRFGAVLQSVTRSFHEVSRPLLTPDECMRLKAPVKNADGSRILEPGDVLVFAAGFAPVQGTQSLYFRDPVFSERARIAAPASDRVRGAGSQARRFPL
jgi:type IV secretion system protein VirD4